MLLICGGVLFSIVFVGCASALRVSSVWMCFVEFAGSVIGGRETLVCLCSICVVC